MNLPIFPKQLSDLEIVKIWWNCARKRKDVHDAICTAVLDNLNLCDLEPLGLEERIVETLEHADIYSVEDLVSRSVDEIADIKFIAAVNLWKILRTIKLLPKLNDQMKDEYFHTIAPNFEEVVNKRFDFVR